MAGREVASPQAKGGGSLFAYEIPPPDVWQGPPAGSPPPEAGGPLRGPIWKRTTVAAGFRVRSWGQINPGAPGFPYVFYPHESLKAQGARPHILLAGDCSHAAYVYRPAGQGPGKDGEGEAGASADPTAYELMVEINCGGTVGSLAVAHLPFLGGEGAGRGQGWAKLFIPNFDTNKVYVFSFGPERLLATQRQVVLTGVEPLGLPTEAIEALEARWKAREQEEDEILHDARSYGRSRGEATKLQ
jgi:hypothetical protein